ncbi:DUF7793 family protein [Sinomicrobium sp. M5D2P9]
MNCHENKFARLWVHKGILFFEYKPGITLNSSISKRVLTACRKLQGKKRYPVFCDIRGVVAIEKAGRDYLAGGRLTQFKAIGFLAEDLAMHMMIRYFREKSDPGIPIRVFTNKKAALRFLLRQL